MGKRKAEDANDEQYKKSTLQARTGIKGEAFFESLVADYALPHHIVGPKDIGLDFVCEWVCGEKPTGILWAAQVKTRSDIVPRPAEGRDRADDLNRLEQFTIPVSRLGIDGKTLQYWKGLCLPTYLFVVICTEASDHKGERLDCYYRRFTPELTTGKEEYPNVFFRVSESSRFLAFANEEHRTGGFARDLFIDYLRCMYYKGSIAYLNPRTLGLGQFPEKDKGVIFGPLFNDYRDQICETYARTKGFLEQHCGC
ncbi:MAG: DUF4365 domain-containing protein [Planctomycetia bacterium]|nr:DUF4365 domain-containing protein [Planctomycetia bacterium]